MASEEAGTPGRTAAAALLVPVLVACSPTVRIEAPAKPIEINLNVRIDQEVRVKVDRELENVYQQNPDIF